MRNIADIVSLMATETGSIDIIDPADDYYCETCGYAYDELRWEINDNPDGWEYKYEIATSVGCTGGEAIYTHNADEALAFLAEAAEDYEWARDDINELIEKIRSTT